MLVRSAPILAAMALTIALEKRVRPSTEPPHLSVRLFELASMNCGVQ